MKELLYASLFLGGTYFVYKSYLPELKWNGAAYDFTDQAISENLMTSDAEKNSADPLSTELHFKSSRGAKNWFETLEERLWVFFSNWEYSEDPIERTEGIYTPDRTGYIPINLQV